MSTSPEHALGLPPERRRRCGHATGEAPAPAREERHGARNGGGKRDPGQAILSQPLCAGAHRDRDRHRARALLSGSRRADEAARRRLHQDDQDDHRADHLLHRRAWHRQHAGHEKGRARRPQGADLLRGADHDRADRRPDRGEHPAARRRHERRREVARHQVDPGLRGEIQGAGHDPVPDGRHSQHGRRSVRVGRDPAGAVLRHPVRVRPAGARRARQGTAQRDRRGVVRPVRRGRDHHEGRADRGVRRDGVHHRQIRRGDALVAREADGRVLRDLHHLRRARARLLRLAGRLQHLQVHPLHQGRAADRARDIVLRSRCCRA